VTAYGGYSRSSRTPTPAELACASPDAPCSLTNFFVADPDLKAPRAGTVEAGLRGSGGRATWRLGVFRTDVADDIQMVASEVVGRAYFANVGATRREGLEAEAQLRWGPVTARASYAHVAATFRTPLQLDPGENPAVPEGRTMRVRPGDRLPGVPADSLKLGLDWDATGALSLGLDAKAQSGRYLQGDEANLNPSTPGFVVLGARASLRLTPWLTLFGEVDNLLDGRYATFGGFSPTALVPILEAPGASSPRSLSPAAPRAAYVGARLSL
jgi:outer membrane receptor protein involved in Fe transport